MNYRGKALCWEQGLAARASRLPQRPSVSPVVQREPSLLTRGPCCTQSSLGKHGGEEEMWYLSDTGRRWYLSGLVGLVDASGSSLPAHPLENLICIPFSSSGSCCYHGNYVHSCISLASGKTPFSLFPFSTLDVRLWQSEGGEACKGSDNWGKGSSYK